VNAQVETRANSLQPFANNVCQVHCDAGHNRSPTLVLLALLHRGLSLREAYRRVFETRPDVDPLPNYRRLLRSVEVGRFCSMAAKQQRSAREMHACEWPGES